MTNLTETGGTFSIASFELQMFGPTNVWTSLINTTTSQTLSYTQTNLITGVDYRFRVRASNNFGWGLFSDELTIRTDDVPSQIVPVETTNENVNVRISWKTPSTDNGSPILEYKIYFLGSNNTVSETASCDGTDSDIVISQTPSCLVSVSELRKAPFSLTKGMIVKAQVKARNIEGWSPLSNTNT